MTVVKRIDDIGVVIDRVWPCNCPRRINMDHPGMRLKTWTGYATSPKLRGCGQTPGLRERWKMKLEHRMHWSRQFVDVVRSKQAQSGDRVRVFASPFHREFPLETAPLGLRHGQFLDLS